MPKTLRYERVQPEKKKGKGIGPSKEVAAEFIDKTPPAKRKLFAKRK